MSADTRRPLHKQPPKQAFLHGQLRTLRENLVEVELFGYRKGSLTGTVSDRENKFDAAAGGAILLDEVGELPLATQVKLLSVLQQREIDVIGDPVPRQVDVRIVTASNRDLQQMLSDGDPHEGLHYRMLVAPLTTPPP